MAQDLGRNSLDGENSPATEVDVEFPSPFHRTNWVSQQREKCWEAVRHRGCLMWAVLREEAWVVPGGLGGWTVRRLEGQLREDCDIEISYVGGAHPSHIPLGRKEERMEGREGGRQQGRKEERKAGKREGQTEPGSLCDSSGRKVSRRTSP